MTVVDTDGNALLDQTFVYTGSGFSAIAVDTITSVFNDASQMTDEYGAAGTR